MEKPHFESIIQNEALKDLFINFKFLMLLQG